MGEDGRAGRRRRRAGPGAGPPAGRRNGPRRAGRRVPAPLPIGAGLRRRGCRARPPDRRPGRQPARGHDRGHDRRRGRGRLPAAPRGRARRLRSRCLLRPPRRPVAVRRLLPRGDGGAAPGRPAARRPARPRLAHGPRAASSARAARPGEGRLPRADRRRASRSTTSPTTAGPPTTPSASSASARASRSPAPTRTASTSCSRRSSGSELANTVSPGFAREALTPEFGMGLDGDLRAKGDRFVGILNGIDPDVWDPSRDPALAVPYSRTAPAGKAACRRDLLGAQRPGPRRRRRGARDDRADGPPEGLRPAGRRDAGPARGGCPGRRPGQRPRVTRRPVPRARGRDTRRRSR